MLPSRFNGRGMEQGGTRGELAVHPALPHFGLHNSASDNCSKGSNTFDEVLRRTAEADLPICVFQRTFVTADARKSRRG